MGSWTEDTIQQLVTNLQSDGGVIDIVNNERAVKMGLEETIEDVPQNEIPAIRVIWLGTTEEDEEGDNLSTRYITLNLALYLIVMDMDSKKRLSKLAELEERVKNAIYRQERAMETLVNDEIDISSTEVLADFGPSYGLAIMNVALRYYDDRDARNGR